MSLDDLRQRATELDARNGLARFRGDFYLTAGHIYLDGNSLGLASRAAEAAVLHVLATWKARAIEGWTHGPLPWLSYTEQIATRLAPHLGATADEIAVGNSTTVNLHQLLATLYQPGPKRSKILVDALSFPSNLYAIESHLRLRGLDPKTHLVVVPSRDGFTVDEGDLIARMSDEVNVAVLPSVLFQSGQLLDLQRLSAEARRRGVLIGFDCSHSVGVLPHQLDAWDADFAYWCTYKYLNGGPGSTAALYLNRRHHGTPPGLAGWFGSRKDRQFDFAPQFEPAATAQAMEIATPNLLSMAPLLASLEQLADAGIDAVRRTSLQLTDYLLELFDHLLAECGFGLITPREEARRGGHVSVLHPDAARICAALRAAGVTTDFRPPAMIRLTPSPLYVSFADVFEAVRRLHEIVTTRSYETLAAHSRVI